MRWRMVRVLGCVLWSVWIGFGISWSGLRVVGGKFVIGCVILQQVDGGSDQ